MPTSGPRILIRGGITYAYDITRSKFLSTSRTYITGSARSRTVKNQYLNIHEIPSLALGESILYSATITSISLSCETPHSWTLQVFKKGHNLPIGEIPVSSSTSASNLAANIDIDAGDVLQLKASGTNIPFPKGQLEIAWRL